VDLYKVLDQVVELLRSRKRVTYRMLGRQFDLDDTALDDLKEELLFAHPHIRDEEGRGLIWTDDKTTTPETTSSSPPSTPQPAPQKTSSIPINPLSTTTTFEAERRQLTVMFCDLVDSTALSGRLDPEDLREVIKGYQVACTQVIKRYDGHTAQLLGDGLLVTLAIPRPMRTMRSGQSTLD
jgi:class 3 adenylate cyclase